MVITHKEAVYCVVTPEGFKIMNRNLLRKFGFKWFTTSYKC